MNRQEQSMHALHLHRLSARILLILSLIALLTVGTGYFQPPQQDEGTAAHIFQLTIVLTALAGMVFLATADWRQPRQFVRAIAFPATALLLAFAALYYLEHFYYPMHAR
jgi:Na+/H+ antiporter NhaD/arsenite permease-like protein